MKFQEGNIVKIASSNYIFIILGFNYSTDSYIVCGLLNDTSTIRESFTKEYIELNNEIVLITDILSD
jgi:hypothetical protein